MLHDSAQFLHKTFSVSETFHQVRICGSVRTLEVYVRQFTHMHERQNEPLQKRCVPLKIMNNLCMHTPPLRSITGADFKNTFAIQ